ncbi:MAG: Nif3-like dinuclear metal center hexameric protein [Gaiellaceae bacterium]
MADRDEIIAYADELLDVDAYPDYGPMGMQVPGAREVSRVVCAVSSSLELFERAAQAKAELILVHHGLFWDRDPRAIDETLKRRLRTLFDADMTLAAYHLALDAHPEVGNNALLARDLGIEPERRFVDVGFGGKLTEPVDVDGFSGRVQDVLGSEPLVFASGPALVETAAVVSGGGGRLLADAAREGYDLFLTGEAEEWSLQASKELGIHFVAGGHYATERIGIKALTANLADRFGLEWEFVELPNPV